MSSYTQLLENLVNELYNPADNRRISELSVVTDTGFRYPEMVLFDSELGGIGIYNVNDARGPNEAPYDVSDRDVFRPIQYCSVYFAMDTQVEWLSREIVHMCGLHLESILKRIVGLRFAPLGRSLREKIARQKIEPVTWEHLMHYSTVYNASKHDIPERSHDHLFSPRDAVQSYFVCRKLSIKLLHQVRLETLYVE